jgi:hypothetical protein
VALKPSTVVPEWLRVEWLYTGGIDYRAGDPPRTIAETDKWLNSFPGHVGRLFPGRTVGGVRFKSRADWRAQLKAALIEQDRQARLESWRRREQARPQAREPAPLALELAEDSPLAPYVKEGLALINGRVTTLSAAVKVTSNHPDFFSKRKLTGTSPRLYNDRLYRLMLAAQRGATR